MSEKQKGAEYEEVVNTVTMRKWKLN
ncbi:Protein CBG27118 [Caenorhabditis briggsae]|uniref:Protein CBG27118 n=1 Tax=Caenorhabditis briggsae TaxID=6238 RepID=B6IHJ2_CAEBR|nr:Protein CBG27118 [Caenorhabditis briggsae]CAR99372.1 Protein CBG27118 [Caenorhabditis briggsae]